METHIIRSSKFPIGTVHGVLIPVNQENRIRNALYYGGSLLIEETRTKTTLIRLFAYEIPIVISNKGASRVESIDLLGYNAQKELFIIELKTADSEYGLIDTIAQIRRYQNKLMSSLKGLQKEFRGKFLLPEFTFSPNVIKTIILAPKYYFDKNRYVDVSKDTDIQYCYFAREIKPIADILTETHPEISKSITRIAIYKDFTQG